jgi:hypothetical protein
MDCWANCISGCSNNISKEHYISDGFFEGTIITAFGLRWCNDKPKKIGLSSAVSKILCTTHNNALSPYDSEASKLSAFLNENIRDKPLEHQNIGLNGIYLEKWALKTLFNLGYIGGLDQDKFTKLIPPPNLVSYLYNKETAGEGMGLYFISNSINAEEYSNSISWNTIRNIANDGKIIGMTFTLNGLRFIINTQPIRAETLIKNMGTINGVDYSKANIEYHPKTICFKSKTAGTKLINFTW